MYDLAVAGAGPAGARFTRRVADAGYDVLALEKGEVGTPSACPGHVSTNIWEHAPDEMRSRLFQNRIHGASSRVGGPNSKAYPFHKQSEVLNVIDRVELDRTLADCARDAGAGVCEGHTITAVEELDDRVRPTVSVTGETGTVQLETKMAAGCDGLASCVRRAPDLPEPSETPHGVFVSDPDPDDGDFMDVYLTVPRFFAWRTPRGDADIEYDLAVPPGVEVNEMLGALTSTCDVETEHFCSGAIPIGPPDRMATRRAFLVGDAAAQTEPFTGDGILYGMIAVGIAASTIDPDDSETLSVYESAWRDEPSREIRLGHLVRWCYSFLEWSQRVDLRPLSGEIGVHMGKSSLFFSREHLKKLL